jgi:hypothetical protein
VRRAALALLLPAAIACHRPAEHVVAPEPTQAPRPNLLVLQSGASVVSRSAELDLGHSAVRLIDNAGSTGWVTPAEDPVQTVVLSLAAPARIDRIGLTSTRLSAAARDVRVDFSLDGVTFGHAKTPTVKQIDDEQDFAVTPAVDAQYIRLSTLDGRSAHLLVRDLVVNGSFLKPPAAGSIAGCWTIGGQPATFRDDDATVIGSAGGTLGMMLDGGTDGRFYRFVWTRDKQYGLAAITVTPDGKHLAGIVWHEQAIDLGQFYADDWIGERGSCPAPQEVPPSADVFTTYLQRFGYFPLYALRFSDDGTLDDDASSPVLARVSKLVIGNPQLQIRFVAHELTQATPAANLTVAQKEIATLRDALSRRGVPVAKVTFVALGEAQPRRAGTTGLIRAMYSSVDVELRR